MIWMIDGKHACQQEEERKGDISTARIFQEQLFFRPPQEHSGRNLIDPSVQDNVIIQSGFFQQISHVECAFNLHSIINNGLILGGQHSRKRLAVFFPLRPETKAIKILQRLTSIFYVEHNTCTVLGRHIKMRYFGLKKSCDSKGIDILSDSIECNHPSRNTSSLLYPKRYEIEDWISLI